MACPFWGQLRAGKSSAILAPCYHPWGTGRLAFVLCPGALWLACPLRVSPAALRCSRWPGLTRPHVTGRMGSANRPPLFILSCNAKVCVRECVCTQVDEGGLEWAVGCVPKQGVKARCQRPLRVCLELSRALYLCLLIRLQAHMFDKHKRIHPHARVCAHTYMHTPTHTFNCISLTSV